MGGVSLPHISPSAAGVDAAGIRDLVTALNADPRIEMHSIAIARAGSVVAEGYWRPYAVDRPHLLYSVSKTWTATAIGVLVAEGHLALDDPVCRLLPGVDLSTLAPRWRTVTVRHCLQMATGHHTDAWGADQVAAAGRAAVPGEPDPVVASILAHEPEHEPGTHFAYNQVATYLAGAAARAVAGTDLVGILRERVLSPLGVPDLPWLRTATGAELSFSGSHARTRDLLALAQLYLDEGVFAGQRVLPAEWVEAARAPSGLPNPDGESFDWQQGYGCSFWQSRHGYRGDGAYGQFALVLPDQGLAVATTAETEAMDTVLDLMWEHLLPAVDRRGPEGSDAELSHLLAGLAVPAPSTSGAAMTGDWTRRSGDLAPSYAAARVVPRPRGGHDLTLVRDGAPLSVTVGESDWVESRWFVDGLELPLVARGGVASDGTFGADIRVIETAHVVRLRTDASGGFDLSWRAHPLHGNDPIWLGVPAPATPV